MAKHQEFELFAKPLMLAPLHLFLFHLAVCDSGSPHCMRMALSSCSGPWWVEWVVCRLVLGRGTFLFLFRLQQVRVELSWLDTEGLREG